MKIALIQCPVWGTREPPLALVQLSSCLKSKGHQARSFDLNNYLYKHRTEGLNNLWAWEQSSFWYNTESVRSFFSDNLEQIEDYCDDIMRPGTRIVGFSVSASNYNASVELSRMLKKKDPSIKVVFGGQAYLDRKCIERTLMAGPVDIVIDGEADETLPELASLIESGSNIDSCKGLYYLSGSDIIETGARRLMKDLDALPYMDYSDLKIEDYDDTVHISLMASRGCVWNCAFCSSRSFWHGYRFMSGERIHQEITYHRSMQKIGMSHVDFMDLAFNGNMERVREFARLMVKYPPYPRAHKMQWVSNAIIHPGLDRETSKLLAESGCQRLIFGIESGSKRVLKLMKKNYDPEVAVRVIKYVSEAGIKVTCNFMFGFPAETEEDFNETLEFLRSIAPYVERVYPSRTYCAIEEFSLLHDRPEEFGIKTPVTHHLYWETKDGVNIYPVRLKRCQNFEKLCDELGVRVDCGVRTSVDLDEFYNLGYYYDYLGDTGNALRYFGKYLVLDPNSDAIKQKVSELEKKKGAL